MSVTFFAQSACYHSQRGDKLRMKGFPRPEISWRSLQTDQWRFSNAQMKPARGTSALTVCPRAIMDVYVGQDAGQKIPTRAPLYLWWKPQTNTGTSNLTNPSPNKKFIPNYVFWLTLSHFAILVLEKNVFKILTNRCTWIMSVKVFSYPSHGSLGTLTETCWEMQIFVLWKLVWQCPKSMLWQWFLILLLWMG